MSDHRAPHFFRHLDEPVRERLFAELNLETKAAVARLLAYPENTAGSIMTTEFVSVPSTWTVGETLDYVRKVEKTREAIYAIYIMRIALWQNLGIFDYGEHWVLVAMTVGAALVGIVTFGSLAGSMLPFILKRIGFDPASASAPFVATLVDVTGLVIYFSIALIFL